MRYFYYTNKNRDPHESTVIILDAERDKVSTFPPRTNYSSSVYDWLDYYKHRLIDTDRHIFEICVNQFNKFKDQGIVPLNWDY